MKGDRTGRVGNSEVHIPRDVIRTLGAIALLGLVGSFVLVYTVVRSTNELDAVTATLITAFMAVGSNAAVALGAILATTNKGAPQPVTVENKPSEPIPTTDATTGNPPAEVEIHPDAPAESDL